MLSRLKQEDIVVDGVAPTRLTRFWPPALPEWSTKAVRDAFYASPRFPRLLKPEAVKDTISRGLDAGLIAYVGKLPDGRYDPFVFNRSLAAADIEISEDTFLIRKEDAETYLKGLHAPGSRPVLIPSDPPQGEKINPPETPPDQPKTVSGFAWSGNLPHQKWMNFYTKVLSRFANSGGLTIAVTIDVVPPGGVSASAVEETKSALRELGAEDNLRLKD